MGPIQLFEVILMKQSSIINDFARWGIACLVLSPFAFGQNLFENPGFENGTTSPFIGGVQRGTISIETTTANVHLGQRSLKHVATGNDSYTNPWKGSNLVDYGGVATTFRLSVWAKANAPNTRVQIFLFCLDANQGASSQFWSSKVAYIGTSWQQVSHEFTCVAGRKYVAVRLDNDGGAGSTVWWDDVNLAKVGAPFPAPPSPVTHTAIASTNWNNPLTWDTGSVPGNGAVVHIPAGFNVGITSVENARLEFVLVDGTLRQWIHGNTRLRTETLYISPSGFFMIGNATNTVKHDVLAEIELLNDGNPIASKWDPKQISRGFISDGKVRMYGESKTNMADMDFSANKGVSSINLQGPVPSDWQAGDQLVLTGTQFARNAPHQHEVIMAQNIVGTTIQLTAPLQFNHHRVSTSMNLHVANLTRNIRVQSESTPIPLRGHVMFRNGDVDVRHVAFIDLGRTDKTKPLDEVIVDIQYNQGDPVGYTVTPNPNIQNRRGRYAVHFHRNGTYPGQNPPSKVWGCVVIGTPGWGYVNHSSHVDFLNNVCLDFAGSGFVTEAGDELGNFENNIAIHGTGVPGQYFFIRQVFASLTRPQPLGDFAFGGDGFWFQGPALRVINNVANSCNGTGMFWFTTGAVDIADDRYVGFPTSKIAAAYSGYPNIGSLTWRRWNTSGQPAVISDLPILEMDGFDGYANLVGFRLRFNNFGNNAFYGEDPFDYDQYQLGTANRIRQAVRNIRVWNNEQGFRIRYNEKTDWTNVTNINQLRFSNANLAYVGAEFFHQAKSQSITNITISGYALASWLISGSNDNSSEITFFGQNYSNYANFDTKDGSFPCARVQGVGVTGTTSSTATIHWDFHSDAERFLLRYRRTGTEKWQYATQTNGSATSYTLTNLQSTSLYDYQVIAGCGENLNNWASNRTFTTL